MRNFLPLFIGPDTIARRHSRWATGHIGGGAPEVDAQSHPGRNLMTNLVTWFADPWPRTRPLPEVKGPHWHGWSTLDCGFPMGSWLRATPWTP